MKLNRTQWGLIIFIALLTTGLYLLPKKVLQITKEGASRDQPAKEGQASSTEPGPSLKSVQVILSESLASLTDKEKKDLEIPDSNAKSLDKVIRAYKKLDNKLGMAICMEKMRDKYNDRELGFAYYEAFKQSKVEENRKSIGSKTMLYLQSYTDASSDDLKAKCAYADCYVNTMPAPMVGIGLLRDDVLKKDSTNEDALLLLGLFSIKSGQYDKAVPRFQSLVRHYPDNVKYSLYLAQLFSKLGDDSKALETLTAAKKKATRKSALDSLNVSIEQLK